MAMYPRKVTALGTERFVSAVGILSKLSTCGVLVMGRRGGSKPEGPSPSNPPETYIYLDGGTPTVTPMAAGVNEVMNNPGAGTPLGPAIPTTSFNPRDYRGITVLGSNRVSSSVKICGPTLVTPNLNLPAFGIMYNFGANIMYFYVTDTTPSLCYGNEAAWLVGSPANVMGILPPQSGSLGNLRDGRTVFGNDDDTEAVVIESGGRSGALLLLAGDYSDGIALYINAAGTPVFDIAANWYTYANS